MIIEKLIEFAKTGDKNTDDLDLSQGFPSKLQPARQWHNWLFNKFSLKINEVIDILKTSDDNLNILLYSPIAYPLSNAPSGFLSMAGQVITKEQYPILYSLYGAKLPDMRAEFIRGFDAGRGVDVGRTIQSIQTDEVMEHDHPRTPIDGFFEVAVGDPGQVAGDTQGSAVRSRAVSRTGKTGGVETRPRNIAFHYIVKAG